MGHFISFICLFIKLWSPEWKQIQNRARVDQCLKQRIPVLCSRCGGYVPWPHPKAPIPSAPPPLKTREKIPLLPLTKIQCLYLLSYYLKTSPHLHCDWPCVWKFKPLWSASTRHQLCHSHTTILFVNHSFPWILNIVYLIDKLVTGCELSVFKPSEQLQVFFFWWNSLLWDFFA